MRLFAVAAVLVLAGCGGDVGSARVVQTVADTDSPGAQRYASQCSSCHAADGGGQRALAAPALTHLSIDYLHRQLRHFRDGVRGSHPDDTSGAVMAAAVDGLSDADLDLLANYIPTLPAAKPSATLVGDIGRGKDHYSNICSACHGVKAQGNPALDAPALAGVDDWYLLTQYEHFREGVRGAHPADRWGAQMLRIAPVLEDTSTVRDVIAWIATQAAE